MSSYVEFDWTKITGPVIEADERRYMEEAKATLPEKTRKYYENQWSYGMDRPGAFRGFACRSCNRWAEYGHDKDCPVGDMEKNQ